jgi:hypothetical protein
MKAYDSMSYWDAYLLPVPIRKWLIIRHNKYMEEQDKDQGTDEPLSQSERIRMINQAQQTTPKPLKSADFMKPVRNR